MTALLFAALLATFAAAPDAGAIGDRLEADLDGDGRVETVVASPARGAVRIQVRDAGGKTRADAKAPAPAGDVVPFTLTSDPLGGSGALVEVTAATDALECRTFWRYRDGALAKLPVVAADGKALPDCAAPSGGAATRWIPAGAGRPAAWVRERTQKTDAGVLVTREAYAFAGFSLDYDAARSAVEIGGVPIPSWFAATLYSRDALEILYSRFGLAAMRREPSLRLEADRARGVFALQFTGPSGTRLLPVDSYAASGSTATLGAHSESGSARVEVRLGGEGNSVPLTAIVNGLGSDWDRSYSPAGAWRGGARQVFPNAADELASEDLAGLWGDPRGSNRTVTSDTAPPYRVRMDGAVYRVDVEGAAPPFDALLLPVDSSSTPPGGRPWGIVLKGPNAFERVPAACPGTPPAPPCRPDGEGETLRRVGARINAQ